MAAVRGCSACPAAVRFEPVDRHRLLVHRARRQSRIRAGTFSWRWPAGACWRCRRCGRRLCAGAARAARGAPLVAWCDPASDLAGNGKGAWRAARAAGFDRPQPAVVGARPAARLHAGDFLRLSCRRRRRARPPAHQGHRLVGRSLRGLRHPRPSFRSGSHPVARQRSLSRFGHRDLH